MQEIQLKNGIVVTIEDKTVPLTGGLYMVRLEIRYSLALEDTDTELRACCGDRIVKTRLIERPAVHMRHLNEVTRSMQASYLESTLRYMERPKFAARLKEKTLQEYHEKLEKEAKLKAAYADTE
ncbi:MAG: hypothetical protein ABFD81_05295 [Syntrophaceae bacterium]